MSDEQLFLLVKEGNQLAFNHLYNTYWKRLFVYTYNILKNEKDTEDVLQEVLVNIWVKKNQLHINNIKSYLFNSVRNKAITKLRKGKFEFLEEEVLKTLSIPNTIEQIIEKKDLEASIARALKLLPERCRTIFYMSRYDDYSIKQIASYFSISHRTVENQLHRALKHLRNSIYTIVSFLFLTF